MTQQLPSETRAEEEVPGLNADLFHFPAVGS